MSSSTSYLGFKELEFWRKGRELRIKILILVKQFPTEEKYKLVSQMTRASRSIINNIAEGYGNCV